MRNISLFTLSAILFLQACATKETIGELEQTSPKGVDDRKVNLSELAEEAEYIRLEVTDNSLVARIADLAYHSDRILISDGRLLYSFDKEGNFLGQIGKTGDGPGDYNFIKSFAIDRTKSLIYIAGNTKLMVFSLDGDLRTEVKLPFIQNIYTTPSGIKFISHDLGIQSFDDGRTLNQTYLISLSDQLLPEDTVILRSTPVEGIKGVSMPRGLTFLTSVNGDDFVYFPVPSFYEDPVIRDTLYQVTDNGLKAHLKLNIPLKNSKEKGFNLLTLARTKSYVLSKLSYDRAMRLLIHHRGTNTTYLSKGGLSDDLFGSGIADLIPLDADANLFFYVKEGPDMVDVLDGATEDDNPYVFLVKLKD